MSDLFSMDSPAVLSKHEDDVVRLRALVSNLHGALGVALFRLEEGGLVHRDLRLPLQEAADLLALNDGPLIDRIEVSTGPFVHGMLDDVPLIGSPIRFVFDFATDRVASLEIKTVGRWEKAKPETIEAFKGWLMDENEDMLDHPENWELEKSDSLPIWHD